MTRQREVRNLAALLTDSLLTYIGAVATDHRNVGIARQFATWHAGLLRSACEVELEIAGRLAARAGSSSGTDELPGGPTPRGFHQAIGEALYGKD